MRHLKYCERLFFDPGYYMTQSDLLTFVCFDLWKVDMREHNTLRRCAVIRQPVYGKHFWKKDTLYCFIPNRDTASNFHIFSVLSSRDLNENLNNSSYSTNPRKTK